ncbi:hypothetical protein PR048_011297 [Dryococelus australis]|uniref:Uncharacterized protein n=1 Tax=Dryococelus australis TaxID=614101 RepID=A0ABQ9HL79_9NEOP|nr:hypothetical protein PR048_011297 [Dryococelus australis]
MGMPQHLARTKLHKNPHLRGKLEILKREKVENKMVDDKQNIGQKPDGHHLKDKVKYIKDGHYDNIHGGIKPRELHTQPTAPEPANTIYRNTINFFSYDVYVTSSIYFHQCSTIVSDWYCAIDFFSCYAFKILNGVIKLFGLVVRLLTSHPDESGSIPRGVGPRFSHVGIELNDAAGRLVFSGISSFPALLHTHLTSPSSDLKTLIPTCVYSMSHQFAMF